MDAAVASPRRPPSTVLVQGLRVEFPTMTGGAKVAIPSLDLDIAKGEIFGLVGESGAGKTTLARSIMGMPPEPGRVAAGRVIFNGRDLMTIGEREFSQIRGRDMTMIVPNPRGELNPLRTIGDQIATVAAVHLGKSYRAARRMAMEMLQSVQISDPERRMNAFPHELSGGMAQRVVIAMALICSPQFVVSDDATSGLDVTVQAQMLELLKELALKRGSAMLFITRDIGIAAHYCSRVAVVFDGEIMELAAREDFFFRPRNPYSIMLMAAFSHNQTLRRMWSRPEGMPRPVGAKTGCPYVLRCPLVGERCVVEHPRLVELEPEHFVRCHYPVKR